MKICIVGQAHGGNAVLWFDLLNQHLAEFSEIHELVFLCRNRRTLEADFETVDLYGSGDVPPRFFKLYKRFMSFVGAKVFFNYFFRAREFDLIHFQGNYSPGFNLAVQKASKARTFVNIYGSDFYQLWLGGKFSPKRRAQFVEVLERADRICCNWISTERDFLREFPQFEEKTFSQVWGAEDHWRDLQPAALDESEVVFLSTRGVLPYNNVDKVVRAFCQAFKGRPRYVLEVVGWGNDPASVRTTKAIVEEHDMAEQVRLHIDQWVPPEKILEMYRRADYNICYGSTDQLSISLVYAFLTNTRNIMSPLPSYRALTDMGYESPVILPEISVDCLASWFQSAPRPDSGALDRDRERARRDFIFSENYKGYVKAYSEILSQPSTSRR